MHIAHVVTRLDIGGAQSHVLHVAGAQHEQGARVTVITGTEGAVSDELRQRGVEVAPLAHLIRSIRPTGDVLAVRDLDRLLRELRPDVVHAHSSKAGILTRLVARRRRLPAVYTAHGWPFVPGVRWPQRVVSRLGETVSGRLWGEVVCVTEADAALARSARVAPPARIHVVPNGIPDVEVAAPGRARTDDAVVITMVARFFPQKDHEGLLQAAALIPPDRHVRLQLVGDGPLLEQTRDRAAQLGLTERVTFAGARTDVAQILADSDIAVLWSRYEGLPLALLEAMRAGLPWVGTEMPAMRAVLGSSESGIVVRDVFELAEALVSLIDDETRRAVMGASGRRRYEEAFTLEPMVAALSVVYQQAMERAR